MITIKTLYQINCPVCGKPVGQTTNKHNALVIASKHLETTHPGEYVTLREKARGACAPVWDAGTPACQDQMTYQQIERETLY